MAGMSEAEIQSGLNSIPGWSYEDGQLTRYFGFDTFMDGIDFVGRAAQAAEAADHHPDNHIRYSTIQVAVSSHDVGGITDRDFKLAAALNELV